MIWKLPPRIKVFEALGSLADGRVETHTTDVITHAKVTSSDGSRFYTVSYDAEKNAITSNDNGSKWQGYLGYPGIAVLMKVGKLPFDATLAGGLKGIAWKKVNTKYKNDWSKTEDEIFQHLDRQAYEKFSEEVLKQMQDLQIHTF